jgi:hypothetical protein
VALGQLQRLLLEQVTGGGGRSTGTSVATNSKSGAPVAGVGGGGRTPQAYMWPTTPTVEHLLAEKHEGMRAVGQLLAQKEGLVGAAPIAGLGSTCLPLCTRVTS